MGSMTAMAIHAATGVKRSSLVVLLIHMLKTTKLELSSHFPPHFFKVNTQKEVNSFLYGGKKK